MSLLTVDEVRAINREAQRYGAANCWTGTSGTLAADIRRLVNHIMEGAGMACEYPEGGTDDQAVAVDHILRGAEELKRERAAGGFKRLAAASAEKYHAERSGAGTLRPGSREFLAVLDELGDLHLRKTLDYGVDEDALANIRQSADVVNMEPWAGCILRIADKMHRLKAYHRRGKTEFDGVEDTLKDIACYAAIALVLYRESHRVS